MLVHPVLIYIYLRDLCYIYLLATASGKQSHDFIEISNFVLLHQINQKSQQDAVVGVVVVVGICCMAKSHYLIIKLNNVSIINWRSSYIDSPGSI